MPDEQQFKRNIAFKLRVGDIIAGKPVIENERFLYLDLNGKKIVRVNLVGNVIDKYESDSGRDKQFSIITLDDGSGQINAKAFGDDIKRLVAVSQGQTVVIIGVLRHFNNELYISPEVIREMDPKYLLIRKIEVEKKKGKTAEPLAKDQMNAVKDKILGAIKAAEEEGGIEMDKLIMTLSNITPVIINQEVEKFLEEGIIFEPRPGKVRYLG
ncbi:MAG: OB-fold nucleic acid binding domain-containing protein [Candidatus Pacearchaeota archaeon]